LERVCYLCLTFAFKNTKISRINKAAFYNCLTPGETGYTLMLNIIFFSDFFALFSLQSILLCHDSGEDEKLFP
jgi:hypothetical protein